MLSLVGLWDSFVLASTRWHVHCGKELRARQCVQTVINSWQGVCISESDRVWLSKFHTWAIFLSHHNNRTGPGACTVFYQVLCFKSFNLMVNFSFHGWRSAIKALCEMSVSQLVIILWVTKSVLLKSCDCWLNTSANKIRVSSSCNSWVPVWVFKIWDGDRLGNGRYLYIHITDRNVHNSEFTLAILWNSMKMSSMCTPI